MSDESLETFEMSGKPEPESPRTGRPERRESTVADRKYLCITIVDHNAVIEQTGEESYISVRIPVALAQSGLKMIPEGKLGRVDPDLIVEMLEEGASGELVSINDQRKTISIRVE